MICCSKNKRHETFYTVDKFYLPTPSHTGRGKMGKCKREKNKIILSKGGREMYVAIELVF
jgi:hypothetical protein